MSLREYNLFVKPQESSDGIHLHVRCLWFDMSRITFSIQDPVSVYVRVNFVLQVVNFSTINIIFNKTQSQVSELTHFLFTRFCA